MSKISGFTEWLPEQRIVELQWMDEIRRTFESYGFCSIIGQVRNSGVTSDLLSEGLEELAFVMSALSDLPQGVVLADLAIARGFDYYTGTVYEGKLPDFPSLGTICSGGRYDNLAGSFINRKLPGVGFSIGLTRLFARLLAEQRVQAGPKCPTQVLVIFYDDERRNETLCTARVLRERGFNVEVYATAGKQGQQLRYAARKGIPYAWFLPYEGKGHEVKNMASGEQVVADPYTWTLT